MKRNFLKILMSLSVASLICSCAQRPAQNNLILIDISGSNLTNIDKTLNRVNDIYSEIMPNDTLDVYFFSSVKYLAYSGKKFTKDRDFLPYLKQGLEKAKAIKVEKGTSFEICKNILESTQDYKLAYLLTDGYFENSKIEKIKLKPDVSIEIVGLSIENNERILKSLSDPKQAKIDFQGN